VPGTSRFILLLSGPETVPDFRSFLFLFLVFEVSRCPDEGFRRASLPLEVFLNLLAADLLVFIFGTIPSLLSHDSLATNGCFSFSLELHSADRAAELAA
jgi:hypothetical protein